MSDSSRRSVQKFGSTGHILRYDGLLPRSAFGAGPSEEAKVKHFTLEPWQR